VFELEEPEAFPVVWQAVSKATIAVETRSVARFAARDRRHLMRPPLSPRNGIRHETPSI
jgi:hypothetical protein